jgi:hypothetical protein
MEMARGARPELFADAGKKDGKERWTLTADTISMLKVMIPKDKRDGPNKATPGSEDQAQKAI